MKCSCFLSLCTGQLESVHSMYAKYATKRKKFFRESQAKASWTGAEPQRPQSHYKSRARPGAVHTPVFKRCRRKLRRAEKDQTFRKDIVSFSTQHQRHTPWPSRKGLKPLIIFRIICTMWLNKNSRQWRKIKMAETVPPQKIKKWIFFQSASNVYLMFGVYFTFTDAIVAIWADVLSILRFV